MFTCPYSNTGMLFPHWEACPLLAWRKQDLHLLQVLSTNVWRNNDFHWTALCGWPRLEHMNIMAPSLLRRTFLKRVFVRALPQGTSELQQGPALRTAVLSFQRNFTCGDLQCAALLPSPFCHSKSPLVHLQLKLPLLWECQKFADASKYLTNR